MSAHLRDIGTCTKGKGKVHHALLEVAAQLPLLGRKPIGEERLMSVTRGQRDARPTVTFPTTKYQIILHDDRGTRVNNLPRVAFDGGRPGFEPETC